jgi:hypothetical protein
MNIKNSNILESEDGVMNSNWTFPSQFMMIYPILKESETEGKDFFDAFFSGFNCSAYP